MAVAQEHLNAVYGDARPRLTRTPVPFRAASAVTAFDGLRVDDVLFAASVTTSGVPTGDLGMVMMLRGQHSARSREGEHHLTAGGILCYPSHLAYEVTSHQARTRVVTVERATIEKVAADIAGPEAGPLRVDGTHPVSPTYARFCMAELTHVVRHVLPHDELLTHPLIRADTVDRVARAVLLTFPNTALTALTDPHRTGGGTAEPAVVRRAVDFIDGHATRPVRVTDIADAAGVGVRALQRAFLRHRGRSPLAYLREVRLEGAHRELRAGDPTRGDTVAAVAARWGFSNPGRFAEEYRLRFGRSPRDTLRG